MIEGGKANDRLSLQWEDKEGAEIAADLAADIAELARTGKQIPIIAVEAYNAFLEKGEKSDV